MHIIFIIANENSVPYFNWFAEKSLTQDKHVFSFIAMYHKEPKMLSEMKERGLNAYWIKFDPKKRKRGMINSVFQLIKLFRVVKPDVVHSHLFDDSLPSMLAARIAGVKKRVITKQDTTFHWYYAPKWVKFDRFNNWNATHVHAVASENRKFILEKERAPKEKVYLVRNGFPYDLMTASKSEYIKELKRIYNLENKIVIGTVARYIHWKGHHLIIKAAKELIQKFPNLLFIWAGSDGGTGYKNELQQLIIDNELQDNIKILGWIERYKMPSLYKCMDIYLHPAINEPFGFAISEALMNEVPIIATQTGSTDLIQHLENGYLLKDNDFMDMIKAISYFVERESDRKLIAQKGHQHALNYLTFENMWEGHINMYTE